MHRAKPSYINNGIHPSGVSGRAAFTLLEVLLAIALTAAVLTAATTLLVSVSNIWSSRQESYFFEDHVDGVAEFVQSCFTRAGMEIGSSEANTPNNRASDEAPELEAREGSDDGSEPELSVRVGSGRSNRSGNQAPESSLLQQSAAPVTWAKPPGFASYRDPLINFKLKESPPLFVHSDNAPVTSVNTFLYFEPEEGLSMLWHSELQEEVEDENDLRRTQISPFVKSIRYIYWDERFESWEEKNEPIESEEKDEYQLPRFIKLVFEREGIIKERTISIPVPSSSAVIF